MYVALQSSPGLQWTWCWRAAPPPNVPPGTPWGPTTARWCGHRLQTRSYTEWWWEEERMLSRERNVPSWLRCHEVSALTTCRILFSVSYTEQSWGGILRKAQLPLEKCVQSGVIIGISAVGGYKQKSSSLAPITRHPPTQTCTNTKQMNHQCGGTSPSLSLSLPVFR